MTTRDDVIHRTSNLAATIADGYDDPDEEVFLELCAVLMRHGVTGERAEEILRRMIIGLHPVVIDGFSRRAHPFASRRFAMTRKSSRNLRGALRPRTPVQPGRPSPPRSHARASARSSSLAQMTTCADRGRSRARDRTGRC